MILQRAVCGSRSSFAYVLEDSTFSTNILLATAVNIFALFNFCITNFYPNIASNFHILGFIFLILLVYYEKSSCLFFFFLLRGTKTLLFNVISSICDSWVCHCNEDVIFNSSHYHSLNFL